MREGIGHDTKWIKYMFKDPDGSVERRLRAGEPIDTVKDYFIGKEHIDGNIALNEGLQGIIDIIIGSGSVLLFNSTNANIGVGNGTHSESASQTGLTGASKLYKSMDSGYPQRSAQSGIWRSTFGSAEANFGWEEFTLANGNSDSNVNLVRKVQSKGTKSSGETWTVELQITFS